MEPVIFAREWPILKNIVGLGRLVVKRKKRKETWEYWRHKSTLELRNENFNEDLEILCEVYDVNLFFIQHKISQEKKDTTSLCRRGEAIACRPNETCYYALQLKVYCIIITLIPLLIIWSVFTTQQWRLVVAVENIDPEKLHKSVCPLLKMKLSPFYAKLRFLKTFSPFSDITSVP